MPATALIEVTERAAKKAKDMLTKSGIVEQAIRVKVLAGGCSGMSYKVEPAAQGAQPGDQVVEAHGLKVCLDPKSVLYLVGTTLDYESSLILSRFKFINPNATATCSCGESFTV
jgi:iron-sulfur cluster assembly protein